MHVHHRDEPTPLNQFQPPSAHLILDSYQRVVGQPLLPADAGDADPATLAERLYHAPFVVLAHDTAADPVFFYANLTAQRVFDMPWADITRLPSRYSAEPLAREERQRLLDRVGRDGYIDDYSGVRISASGRRFKVVDATVWNLVDEHGRVLGQAATFSRWLAPD